MCYFRPGRYILALVSGNHKRNLLLRLTLSMCCKWETKPINKHIIVLNHSFFKYARHGKTIWGQSDDSRPEGQNTEHQKQFHGWFRYYFVLQRSTALDTDAFGNLFIHEQKKAYLEVNVSRWLQKADIILTCFQKNWKKNHRFNDLNDNFGHFQSVCLVPAFE